MKLQDWWDCEDWGQMSLNRWAGSGLDWGTLTAYDWKNLSRGDWGGEETSQTSPLFSPVMLDSLGITQDADYVYIPVQELPGLSWQSLSVDDWKNLSTDDWNFPPPGASELFRALILKLQSANLQAHKVTGGSLQGDLINNNYLQFFNFSVDSRTEVV